MFKRAPVAFLCTRISFDFASLVNGPRAPDLAIFALLSSCVARFVMQPTALHCTSTLVEFICRIRGMRPPRSTILTLFSAVGCQCMRTGLCLEGILHILLTARLPRAALAALWTSVSLFCRRKRMGSRVSRPTSRTSERCELRGLLGFW
jgi:hypothetical protein